MERDNLGKKTVTHGNSRRHKSYQDPQEGGGIEGGPRTSGIGCNGLITKDSVESHFKAPVPARY
jgi:hypothetical protein